MVRYLYACGGCKQNFEVEKSMQRSAEAENCPTCGKQGQRVFTAPGIQVKGKKISLDECPAGESGHACDNCEGDCGLE